MIFCFGFLFINDSDATRFVLLFFNYNFLGYKHHDWLVSNEDKTRRSVVAYGASVSLLKLSR